MKNRMLTVTMLFGMLLLSGAAHGQSLSGTAHGHSNDGGRLVGTWDTEVTIMNCSTGAPITSFQSVGSFNEGGTFSGITSGMPPTARTSERGIWEHVRGRLYRFKFKAYLYNPAAVATGYQIVTQDLELDRDGHGWSSEGTSVFFSLDGTQVAAGCSSAIGSRMVID